MKIDLSIQYFWSKNEIIMKVIVIQGLLAPYRYPIFSELSKTFGWDLEVWFMGKDVANRTWSKKTIDEYDFKYKFLKGITLNFGFKDNYPFWINFGLYQKLKEVNPNVVIMMGWDSFTSFWIHWCCQRLGIKFILYSDSTSMEKSWRRNVTLPLVKWHVRTADALLAGGTRSMKYLQWLGVNPENIYISYNTVDIDKYKNLTNEFKKDYSPIKNRLGIQGKRVILQYAQLIERKAADDLILAFKKLKEKYDDLALLLIGRGKFKENLLKLVEREKLSDVIIINDPGDTEVCKYYAISDLFVLASKEEVWGLVVNEAMAAGLPVVVSDKAGSSYDLIKKGVNGYTFTSHDIVDLSEKIENILTSQSRAKQMGENSLALIKNFTPKTTIGKIVEAVNKLFLNAYTTINFQKNIKKNFISVIVPVYKNESGLKETLASLNKQNYSKSKFEIIVQRDVLGSGSYMERNKAIEKSSGEFIAFIDAGSLADEDWLQNASKALQYADYIGGPIVVYKTNRVSNVLYSYQSKREFPVKEFMQDQHFSPTTNLIVKRSLIAQIGGFDARLKSSGDLEFGDRIFRSQKFKQLYDPSVIVCHPARTYSALIKKQSRLAKGFVDKSFFYPERFGKFNLIKQIVKVFIPPVWLISKDSWRKSLFLEKITIFLATYYFGAIQHFKTIQYGFLHKR